MPKPVQSPRDVLRRPTKMAVAKGAVATKPGPARTSGGRITYAGSEYHEQRMLRAIWEGKGE